MVRGGRQTSPRQGWVSAFELCVRKLSVHETDMIAFSKRISQAIRAALRKRPASPSITDSEEDELPKKSPRKDMETIGPPYAACRGTNSCEDKTLAVGTVSSAKPYLEMDSSPSINSCGVVNHDAIHSNACEAPPPSTRNPNDCINQSESTVRSISHCNSLEICSEIIVHELQEELNPLPFEAGSDEDSESKEILSLFASSFLFHD